MMVPCTPRSAAGVAALRPLGVLVAQEVLAATGGEQAGGNARATQAKNTIAGMQNHAF